MLLALSPIEERSGIPPGFALPNSFILVMLQAGVFGNRLLKESNASKDNATQPALLKKVSLLKSEVILHANQLKANEEKMNALLKSSADL